MQQHSLLQLERSTSVHGRQSLIKHKCPAIQHHVPGVV